MSFLKPYKFKSLRTPSYIFRTQNVQLQTVTGDKLLHVPSGDVPKRSFYNFTSLLYFKFLSVAINKVW